MCQITLVDTLPKYKISKAFIRPLTEVNSLAPFTNGKNTDGFGYMLFEQFGQIIKSVDDCQGWWTKHFDEYGEATISGDGIYHVRSASYVGKYIYGKDSHPHSYRNVVLVHNGTLKPDDEALKDQEELLKVVGDKNDNLIDSEKFTRVLGELVGDDALTVNHITEAMRFFTGSFAFLICDIKNPDKVFVVRGKDKNLNKAEIYINEKKVGLVINTGKGELIHWAKIVKGAVEAIFNVKVKIAVNEIPQESIFVYQLGTYELGEKVETIYQRYEIVKTVESRAGFDGRAGFRGMNLGACGGDGDDDFGGYFVSEEKYSQTFNLSATLGLSFVELQYMSEILFAKNIYILKAEEFDRLNDLLIKFKALFAKGRDKEWREFKEIVDIKTPAEKIQLYITSKIQFPFVLNSKRVLKEGRERFTKQHELPTLQ